MIGLIYKWLKKDRVPLPQHHRLITSARPRLCRCAHDTRLLRQHGLGDGVILALHKQTPVVHSDVSYVSPEPVVVNIRFSSIKWRKKRNVSVGVPKTLV
jgi:hypothetical protein